MTQDHKRFAVVALAALGWWLYTRSQGLTLTGQPINPMIPPLGNRQSLVAPSYASSVAATNASNPVAQLGVLINRFFSSIAATAKSGNAPARQSASSTLPAFAIGAPASNAGVASIGSERPVADSSLVDDYPYFLMGFDSPNAASGVPEMSWTLGPDASYIPPPPGA
jgi:hypothetical protein